MTDTLWCIWSLDGAITLKPDRWFIPMLNPEAITTWKTRAGAVKGIERARAMKPHTSPHFEHKNALPGSMIPLPLDIERHKKRCAQRLAAQARAEALIDAHTRAVSLRNRLYSQPDIITGRRVDVERVDEIELGKRQAAIDAAKADCRLACRDDIDMREWMPIELLA